MRNEKVLFKLKYLDSFIYCDIFFYLKKNARALFIREKNTMHNSSLSFNIFFYF